MLRSASSTEAFRPGSSPRTPRGGVGGGGRFSDWRCLCSGNVFGRLVGLFPSRRDSTIRSILGSENTNRSWVTGGSFNSQVRSPSGGDPANCLHLQRPFDLVLILVLPAAGESSSKSQTFPLKNVKKTQGDPPPTPIQNNHRPHAPHRSGGCCDGNAAK